MITFTVPGAPVPQGSMRHIGHGRMISDNPKLKAWRTTVNQVFVYQHRCSKIEGPVEVRAVFVMPRPKSHYGTGRNTSRIKDAYLDIPHVVKPDGDKLIRAVFDALSTTKTQAGAFIDDSHVVRHSAQKRYVRPGEDPHAQITLSPAIGIHETAA